MRRMKFILLATFGVILTACGAQVWADDTPPPDEPVVEEQQVVAEDYGYTTTAAPTTYATTTTGVPNTQGVTTTMASTTMASTTTMAPTTLATTTTAAPTTVKETTTTEKEHKWFVCKYVGTPGVDERLQTGDNPISVDGHSIATFPNLVIGAFFADAQGRSVVIAQDTGQPEPDADEACPPPSGGTTTTLPNVTTTSSTTSTTSTTSSTTTTTIPRQSLLGIDDFATCANGAPAISITFGVRPELNGLIGQLSIISLPNGLTVLNNQSLVFVSGGTTVIPYPAVAAGTTSATLNYNLSGEFATASVGPPPTNCAQVTTTTTTLPASTTTTTPAGPTTTVTGATTTTVAPTTLAPTTTLPATFTFGAASTVCVAEVPTIRITFQSPGFPTLAGQTGTLTMTAVSGGAVVGTQPLVYRPGTTVDILYPGTRVNPDGSIADVPGWILQPNGLWVLDPSDQFLRAGIVLTYTVNPTATATVTYPPESATCANPENPPGINTPATPGSPGATPGGTVPPAHPLPSTGASIAETALLAAGATAFGLVLFGVGRRRRRTS